jgi:hypothetical protein
MPQDVSARDDLWLKRGFLLALRRGGPDMNPTPFFLNLWEKLENFGKSLENGARKLENKLRGVEAKLESFS